MEYKTLGKTGLKVSRMGFGGIPIQKIDEEGTRKLLQDMVKRGINYIDSARLRSGRKPGSVRAGNKIHGENKRSDGSRYRDESSEFPHRLY